MVRHSVIIPHHEISHPGGRVAPDARPPQLPTTMIYLTLAFYGSHRALHLSADTPAALLSAFDKAGGKHFPEWRKTARQATRDLAENRGRFVLQSLSWNLSVSDRPPVFPDITDSYPPHPGITYPAVMAEA